ncbi:hypothetical protein [Curtobacterium sp. MCBD17_040]|uniref:hypothetical protein n=1 Tax=Curtobacterium sp. MCBD17_040 TaxID=2175674 RepID=UPI000DAA0B3B|nr:hypothetical protein [Curtobacterium sp. MCBD17_040]WIB65476.1 hypothetical protein DEI94_19070 [Curtobacterium sp. MCBD17_040]
MTDTITPGQLRAATTWYVTALTHWPDSINASQWQATIDALNAAAATIEQLTGPSHLDPAPFTFAYPSGALIRRATLPAGRTGWRFNPRPGYQQNRDRYDWRTRADAA